MLPEVTRESLAVQDERRKGGGLLSSGHELNFLNLVLTLVVALLCGGLAARLGYPAILGELAGGIVFGPPVLGLLERTAGLTVLAEVGVLLMMLYIGMEIDPRELGRASWAGFLAAIGGFLCPFALGYAAMIAYGADSISALFVGMAMGVTSLATKSRILVDLKLLNTRIAHVMMAGALLSDTAALVLFAAVLTLASTGALGASELGATLLNATAFFGITGVVGLLGFPWLFRLLARAGPPRRTVTFTTLLLIAFLFAEIAELTGFHSILGAFLAGLYLREGVLERKLSHGLMRLVHDLSLGFLAPLFFVMAGFDVVLDVFRSDLPLFLTIMGLAMAGKILGTALFYLPSGHGWREGLTVGFGMNGRGAVEIIIAGIGLERGLISQEIFSILVFMAIFTTMTVPVLLKWGADWLRARGELEPTRRKRTHIVIAGAGPVARLLAGELARSGPVRLVDSSVGNCERARETGLSALQGSAVSLDVLGEAEAGEAGLFVALTPNAEVNLLAAQSARHDFLVPRVGVYVPAAQRPPLGRHLEELAAEEPFGGPFDLEEWDRRLDGGLVEVAEVPGSAAGSLQGLAGPGCLPLAVRRGGVSEVATSATELRPGDTIVLLRDANPGGAGQLAPGEPP